MKTFTYKGKSKTIMQNYDDLAACFENKLNFLNWRLNYLKTFDIKLSLMRYAIYRTSISTKACAKACVGVQISLSYSSLIRVGIPKHCWNRIFDYHLNDFKYHIYIN